MEIKINTKSTDIFANRTSLLRYNGMRMQKENRMENSPKWFKLFPIHCVRGVNGLASMARANEKHGYLFSYLNAHKSSLMSFPFDSVRFVFVWWPFCLLSIMSRQLETQYILLDEHASAIVHSRWFNEQYQIGAILLLSAVISINVVHILCGGISWRFLF